jgi:hypothetical protein
MKTMPSPPSPSGSNALRTLEIATFARTCINVGATKAPPWGRVAMKESSLLATAAAAVVLLAVLVIHHSTVLA